MMAAVTGREHRAEFANGTRLAEGAKHLQLTEETTPLPS
jgi:hypothetical protein